MGPEVAILVDDSDEKLPALSLIFQFPFGKKPNGSIEPRERILHRRSDRCLCELLIFQSATDLDFSVSRLVGALPGFLTLNRRVEQPEFDNFNAHASQILFDDV